VIRAALDSGDFETAASKARDLCQVDPNNYHGYVGDMHGSARSKLTG
jgi:hypothetical protein